MKNWLAPFFNVERMVPERMRIGELPAGREAYERIMAIAIPSVLEMALMSLISMIDTAMVSVLGPHAVTAVGLATQPRLLMLCIFYALNTGVTAIVARRKGENRREEANRTLRNALVIATGLSLVVMAIVLSISRGFMQLAGAAETLEETNTYFRVIAWALPFNALSMCICAAQRGVGNTRLTMYVNMTSNLVNVLFNWFLINGNGPFPKLGVYGAALATAIGLLVGFLLSVFSLFRGHGDSAFLRLSFHGSWRLSRNTIQPVFKVAGSALFEQIFLRVGFFVFARMVAGLGTDNFAAHSIAMQFLTISFAFGDGVGVASTSLVGQMLGQRRPDLAHMYGKIGQRFALILSLVLAASVMLFRRQLVSMFIHSDDSEYVREMAEYLLLIVAGFQPFQMSAVVNAGALRGAGDTRYVAWSMIFNVIVVRLSLAAILIYLIGDVWGNRDWALIGAWCGSFVDITLRMVMMLRRFNGGKWHAIKL